MKSSIYNLPELFVLIPVLGANLGWHSLPEIYRNSRPIIRSQPQPDLHEMCLTYLLIKAAFQHQGYGSSVVQLLVNALKDKANSVYSTHILALVRKHNVAALALFKKQGFTERANDADITSHDDPFRDVEGVGEGIYLEYDLTTGSD